MSPPPIRHRAHAFFFFSHCTSRHLQNTQALHVLHLLSCSACKSSPISHTGFMHCPQKAGEAPSLWLNKTGGGSFAAPLHLCSGQDGPCTAPGCSREADRCSAPAQVLGNAFCTPCLFSGQQFSCL